jgi:hypothetical protein
MLRIPDILCSCGPVKLVGHISHIQIAISLGSVLRRRKPAPSLSWPMLQSAPMEANRREQTLALEKQTLSSLPQTACNATLRRIETALVAAAKYRKQEGRELQWAAFCR